MQLLGRDKADIERAARALHAGGLVAFPTETVYGLGALATNAHAVSRIFAAKGRPADHPLIVHLGNLEQLQHWARNIPRAAWTLAEHFWPGPLTLILPRAHNVDAVVTGGQNSIGLRMPAHPVARALLAEVGTGVAAPSANRYGRLSPTTAEHVANELGDRVEIILDGGPCTVGLESSIVDLTGPEARILRPGVITPEKLTSILGTSVSRAAGSHAPRAPGRVAAHYAPGGPVNVVPAARLLATARQFLGSEQPIAVLAQHAPPQACDAGLVWWPMPTAPEAYGQTLYASLRSAETAGARRILVEAPPTTPVWEAVHDRLQRAAAAAHQ